MKNKKNFFYILLPFLYYLNSGDPDNEFTRGLLHPFVFSFFAYQLMEDFEIKWFLNEKSSKNYFFFSSAIIIYLCFLVITAAILLFGFKELKGFFVDFSFFAFVSLLFLNFFEIKKEK